MEREAVHTSAKSLLDGANGALNLAHVTVSRDNVHGDGVNVFTDALKFVISVNVADVETAGLV